MQSETIVKRTRLPVPAVSAFRDAACGLQFGSVRLRFEVFRGGFNTCEIEAVKTLSDSTSSDRAYDGLLPPESQKEICALAAEIEDGEITFKLFVRDGVRQFSELTFRKGVHL